MHSTVKDFFIYLGTLITLYFSVGSLITLIFSVINRYLPDTLAYSYSGVGYSGGIRFALANLFIVFPVYLFFSWLISKDLEKNSEKRQLGLRRWLTYVHLFVAGAVIIGTLVTLVNYFLGGEVTGRFLLKIIALLAISGGVFAYYIVDLRESQGFLKRFTIFASIATILVIASIVVGFVIIGLPQNQRDVRLDTRRVSDLQSIQWEITNYYQTKQVLPDTLTDLNDGLGNFVVPTDPETKQPYTYTKTAPTTFTLCANFKTISIDETSYTDDFGYSQNSNWQHGTGTTCFDRTIDPERYPSIKQ